jgi:hypothetical protein
MATDKIADAYKTKNEFETAKLQKLIDLLDAFDADMTALIAEFPEAGAKTELCSFFKEAKSGVMERFTSRLNTFRMQYGLPVPNLAPTYAVPTYPIVTPTA